MEQVQGIIRNGGSAQSGAVEVCYQVLLLDSAKWAISRAQKKLLSLISPFSLSPMLDSSLIFNLLPRRPTRRRLCFCYARLRNPSSEKSAEPSLARPANLKWIPQVGHGVFVVGLKRRVIVKLSPPQ